MTSQTFMMQVASSICYTPCVITTTAVPPQMPPLAFSLTADSSASFLPAGAGAGTNFNQCANTDYLVIHGAVDSTMPTSFNDRFCGNNLNPASQTTSVTLCCKWHSFFRRDFNQPFIEWSIGCHSNGQAVQHFLPDGWIGKQYGIRQQWILPSIRAESFVKAIGMEDLLVILRTQSSQHSICKYDWNHSCSFFLFLFIVCDLVFICNKNNMLIANLPLVLNQPIKFPTSTFFFFSKKIHSINSDRVSSGVAKMCSGTRQLRNESSNMWIA